jgi:hypothetical protein
VEVTITFIWFAKADRQHRRRHRVPLILDPVNPWVAALFLAIALDLGASHAHGHGSAKSA